MRPPGLYRGDVSCTGLLAIGSAITLLIFSGAAGLSQQSAQTRGAAPSRVSPTDAQSPLQVHARKALAAGKLAKWEAAWMKKIVAGTVQPKRVRVWFTSYGPWEGYKGDDYHVAANRFDPGTVLYVPITGRLMVVTNGGSPNNDHVAERKGASRWCDIWTRKRGMYGLGEKCGEVYVIGRAPWRH